MVLDLDDLAWASYDSPMSWICNIGCKEIKTKGEDGNPYMVHVRERLKLEEVVT